MLLKGGLIIKEIENEYILIDSGKESPRFNGIIKLNETSKTIINILQKGEITLESLIDELLKIYNTDQKTLEKEKQSQILEGCRKEQQ